MFSSNNNSEIDIDSTYTKYGQCRCCTASGQHRDVDKEYYYNNIKEVYRDIFVECFNLSLSPHNLISSLICENCVNRLRDASSFRMMVASSEQMLLNTVIFKSDPENDTELVNVPRNFTTEVKIENDLEIINMIPSPDVYQDELENSTENELVNDDIPANDKGWVNNNERTNDDVPLNDKERTNDNVPLNDKERTNDNVPLNDNERTNDNVPLNDNERTNDDAPLNDKERTNDEGFVNGNERMNDCALVNDEERVNDDDGWSDVSDDPMNDLDEWSDVSDDPMNGDIRVNDNQRRNDDAPLNDKERVNDEHGWSDVCVDPINDDDDWSTDTDNELVIDEDRGNISSGTDEILTDEDPDGCGSIFNSTITRSETSAVDDEPCAMVKGEKFLLSKFTPVRPLPKRRQLLKICPKFNEHLKKLQYKTVKPKSIEWFFKTMTPKTNETKTKLSDKLAFKACPEKLVKPKSILADKQALAVSIPNKRIEPKSIARVSKTTTPKTKETKTKLSGMQALKASIPDKRIESKSIARVSKTTTPKTKETKTKLSGMQALKASIPDKRVESKSIERVCKTKKNVTKTKLSGKPALKSSILKKLVKSKTILADKQALAASISDKRIESKSIERISKTKTPKTNETKTKLSDKLALEASIPKKIVEPKSILLVKQAIAASISKLVQPIERVSKKKTPNTEETKPKLSDKPAVSIPEKLVETKTIADKQALAASIPDKLIEPKSLDRVSTTKRRKIKEIDTRALALDATTLFEFSNATAFKTKNRSGYPCFYCREVYKYNRLKEHQEEKHPKESIYALLAKYYADEFVVYAEITDLKCTICKKDIKDIKELRDHLSQKHGKKMHKTPDRVIPFKLQENEFECQVCGRIFDTFSLIEKHMNTHFGTFTCKTCGTSFITKHRLAVHNYSLHKDDKIVCKICLKTFGTQMKMRIHYEGVHEKNKTIQCKKCPEKFIDHFSRMKHLADAHGGARHLYQCNECEKGFARRSGLHDHVQRCHLPVIDKKKIKCDKCSFQCYTRSELRDHYIKHVGGKAFECDICKKVYNRYRSLATHIKTHKYSF